MVTARRRLGLAAAVLALAATAMVLALPAAPAAAEPHIVGGQPASKPYPYAAFVELEYPEGGPLGYCTGALVAARYVLTAGHCLQDAPRRIGVTVGSPHVDHGTFAPEYVASAAVRDPRFALLAGDEPVDDVAVLTLPAPAAEAQVRLPRPGDAGLWAIGTRATAVGWGVCFPAENCGDIPDDLREVVLPVQPDSACSAHYNYRSSAMLCAGGEAGRDTCSGDSGGPLTVDDGFGLPVLAGITSFGSGLCGDGSAAVYTRLGGTDLNAWVRGVVPQVELDADATAPVPGQVVTFRASPSRPGGSGPFGGYDAIEWDLDGDGAFGEAAGQTSVQRAVADGVNTVAVRATSTAGDAEVRTLRLHTVQPARVSFATPAATVAEGHAVTLTLRHDGTGAGTVTVTPATGAARRAGVDVSPPGAQTVTFGADEGSRTVTFTIADDHVAEGRRTFAVTLGAFTGALAAADPATAAVTVVDDDPAVALQPSARARHGRLALAVTADRAGRWTVSATGGGHAAARSAHLRQRHAGRRRLALRLSGRVRRALARRHGRARIRIHATFVPRDGRPVTVRRSLTLRRAT